MVADLDDVNAADPHAGLHVLHGEVRHSDEAHLPRANDRIHGEERLLEGCVEVRPVNEVHVDHVGLEPAERQIHLARQARGAGVAADGGAARVPGEPALRHEGHAIPAPAQGLAQRPPRRGQTRKPAPCRHSSRPHRAPGGSRGSPPRPRSRRIARRRSSASSRTRGPTRRAPSARTRDAPSTAPLPSESTPHIGSIPAPWAGRRDAARPLGHGDRVDAARRRA